VCVCVCVCVYSSASVYTGAHELWFNTAQFT